jgi:hypothetical protein
MSLEQRLVEALHQADHFQPSPDLFARLEHSLDEDRASRRRRLAAVGAAVGLASVIGWWVAASAYPGASGRIFIAGWRLVIVYLVVAAVLLVALGPHIRRFGESFIGEIFHLDPPTGASFLAVLDIAYYLGFSGLILVDADVWILDRPVPLLPGMEDVAFRLGSLLAAMGVLHAVNIAVLPALGIVFNSIVRLDRRRRAGPLAPPESARARQIDRAARGLAIAAFVLMLVPVLNLLIALVIGAVA